MKNIIKSHSIYFGLYTIFAVVTLIFLYLYEKQDIHLFFNGFYNFPADLLFTYLTYVGDGFAVVALSIGLLFYNYRWTLQIALSGIAAGILAQFFKKVVFGATPRPSAYFEKMDIPIRYVEGVDLHTAFSFPSGHTTAVFAIMTSLMLLINKKRWEAPLFALALLTGFSRIYLSQHFLADVLSGSFLGTAISITIYYLLFHTKYKNNSKWDQSLISFRKK